MNTPGHFLEDMTGLMPLSTTIFAPATLVFIPLFLACVYTAARLLLPKNPRAVSFFPEACKLADAGLDEDVSEPGSTGQTFAPRLESNRLPTTVLALALVGWLVYHVTVKGGGLQLNSLNTSLLLLCLVLHRSVRGFSKALPGAVVTAWPVIVLYHLYAGVAGLIQYTSVGADFATFFASIANAHTFPLLTAMSAGLVSIFVPSSGGQWVIQGFITTKAAAAVGGDRAARAAGAQRRRPRRQSRLAVLGGHRSRYRPYRLPHVHRLQHDLRRYLVRARRALLHLPAVLILRSI